MAGWIGDKPCANCGHLAQNHYVVNTGAKGCCTLVSLKHGWCRCPEFMETQADIESWIAANSDSQELTP